MNIIKEYLDSIKPPSDNEVKKALYDLALSKGVSKEILDSIKPVTGKTVVEALYDLALSKGVSKEYLDSVKPKRKPDVEALYDLALSKGVSKEYLDSIKNSSLHSTVKKRDYISSIFYNINSKYSNKEKEAIIKELYSIHSRDIEHVWGKIKTIDEILKKQTSINKFIVQIFFRDDMCLNNLQRMKECMRWMTKNEYVNVIGPNISKNLENFEKIKDNSEELISRINKLPDVSVCNIFRIIRKTLNFKFAHDNFNGSVSTRGKTQQNLRLLLDKTTNQELSFNKYYFGSLLAKVIGSKRFGSNRLVSNIANVRRSIRRTFPVPLNKINNLTRRTIFTNINDKKLEALKEAQELTLNSYVRKAKLNRNKVQTISDLNTEMIVRTLMPEQTNPGIEDVTGPIREDLTRLMKSMEDYLDNTRGQTNPNNFDPTKKYGGLAPIQEESSSSSKRKKPNSNGNNSESKRKAPNSNGNISKSKRKAPNSRGNNSKSKRKAPNSRGNNSESKRKAPNSNGNNSNSKKKAPKPDSRNKQKQTRMRLNGTIDGKKVTSIINLRKEMKLGQKATINNIAKKMRNEGKNFTLSVKEGDSTRVIESNKKKPKTLNNGNDTIESIQGKIRNIIDKFRVSTNDAEKAQLRENKTVLEKKKKILIRNKQNRERAEKNKRQQQMYEEQRRKFG